MAVIFESLFVRTDRDQDLIILDDVTGICRGQTLMWLETYRDEFTTPTQTIKQDPVITAGSKVTEGAAFGKEGLTPLADTTYTNLIYKQSDEIAHVPPRFHRELRSGYFVAFNDAPLPTSWQDHVPTFVFSASATTELCFLLGSETSFSLTGVSVAGTTSVFTKVNHGLVDGQYVTVVTAIPLATGVDVSAGSRAVVFDATADTFKLAVNAFEAFDRISVTVSANQTNITIHADYALDIKNGDTVYVSSSGTLPGGLTAGVAYRFLKIAPFYWRLVDSSTGIAVNITSSGSGNHYLIGEQPTYPRFNENVFFIPDAWNPRFSTTNPLT